AGLGDAIELGAIEVVAACHRENIATVVIIRVQRGLHPGRLLEREDNGLWRTTFGLLRKPSCIALLVVDEIGEALDLRLKRPLHPYDVVPAQGLGRSENPLVVGRVRSRIAERPTHVLDRQGVKALADPDAGSSPIDALDEAQVVPALYQGSGAVEHLCSLAKH